MSITVGLCLSQLPGFCRTSGPQRDGGICERATAHLDLPFVAWNEGRAVSPGAATAWIIAR